MSNTDATGATVAPGDADEKAAQLMECPGDGKGQRFQHHWNWLWVAGLWTNKVQCSTCGITEVRE